MELLCADQVILKWHHLGLCKKGFWILNIKADELTWSGFARDPDGGWSPGHTLSWACIAVYTLLWLEREMIWKDKKKKKNEIKA